SSRRVEGPGVLPQQAISRSLDSASSRLTGPICSARDDMVFFITGSANYFFGFHSAKCAPVGSASTLNQPNSGISVTSFITLAPRDFAFLVEAWISSTSTYASQNEGAPGMGFFIMPPPVPSPTRIIV